MDSQIEKLKEKYWAGNTSPEEEKELKSYFRKKPSFSEEGNYFRTLSMMQEERTGKTFEHPAGRKKPLIWLAAACLIILVALGIFLPGQKSNTQQFAVQDPAEAYAITKASLVMVSQELNKGKTYSTELKKINEAKQILNK